MIIFPAIDLREGRCVRLLQGRKEDETVYSDNPAEMAKRWQDEGAEYLHVVDLDGAFVGRPQNQKVISEIVNSVSIPVQVGGGIRTPEAVEELLELGVDRVILGTIAINKPQLVGELVAKYGADRIVLGLDSKDGKVAVEGWEMTVEKDVIDLALEMKEIGITRIIFTDTRRDGMLMGPNFDATAELASKTGLKVIASGGVSSIEDMENLKKMEHLGIEGVIMGKALYTGAVNLKEALEVSGGVNNAC